MSKNEIGEQLSLLRKKYNYSQDDLAQKLNISRQAISNWERGKSEPDMKTILELSEIYQVSTDELLVGSNSNNECNQYYISKQSTDYSTILFVLIAVVTLISLGCVYVFNSLRVNGTIISSILLSMSAFVYYSLGYMIKNEDFTMLAGYGKNANYNIPILKKMLTSIKSYFLLSVFVTNVLSTVLMLTTSVSWAQGLLLVIFVINFLTYVIFINVKYQDEIMSYDNSLEKKNAKKLTLIVTSIVMMLISIVLVFVGSTTYFEIRNNSIEILLPICILLISVIFNSGALVYENAKCKKCLKEDTKYKVSRMFFIAITISIISCFAIFYICFKNAIL